MRTPIAWSFALTAGALLGGCEAPQPPTVPYPAAVRAAVDEDTGSRDAADAATAAAAESQPAGVAAGRAEPVRPPRPSIGDDRRFSFHVPDGRIAEALFLICNEAGMNLVIPEGVTGTISATLEDVTLDEALEAVLNEGGLELVRQAGGEASKGVWSVRPVAVPDRVTRVFRAASADLTGVDALLLGIVGEHGGTVTVNPQANVLFVSAPPAVMPEVERFLAEFDTARREVLIEARIVEVTLDEGFELGISTSSELSAGDTTTTILTDFLRDATRFSVAAAGDKADVAATLRALQTFGTLHVIASPRVLAMNQELARIEIIEQVPYVESTNTTTGADTGVSTSSVQQIEFEEVGVRLHVTPVLGDDDQITLKVMLEVSEVVDFFEGVPVTDSRLVDSRFVVGDRRTIVLGGLLNERTRRVEDGVPWVMDLPLVGWLFRGEDVVREKRELLMFITPRIVAPADVAGIASDYKAELVRKSAEYRQDYREFLDDVK